MEAYPFQSNFTGYDEEGNPLYDRAVGASFIHAREKLFYTNGIFPNPSDNFQVTATDTLTVNVQPGACFIQGVTGIEEKITLLVLDPAEELTTRTDIIVLRCDFVNRWIELAVKKNTTALTRTGNIYELKIAEITIPKMAQSISQSAITDTRLSADCGIVTSTVTTVDTSTLFLEYAAKWAEVKATMAANATAYNAWYDVFTTTAESLFNQRIDNFDAWFAEKQSQLHDANYFDFDNLSYRHGYTYSYTKIENTYTETLTNTLSQATYAERVSTKDEDGNWTIRTTCPLLEIDTTETWTKENGTWKGEITQTETQQPEEGEIT